MSTRSARLRSPATSRYGHATATSALAQSRRHARASDRRTTLAVVDTLTADDLRACAARVAAWHDAGLATPLLLAAHEFEPIARRVPVRVRRDPRRPRRRRPAAIRSTASRVDPADLRRACEVQARSHLLHLREGYPRDARPRRRAGRCSSSRSARAVRRAAHERRAPATGGRDRRRRGGRAARRTRAGAARRRHRGRSSTLAGVSEIPSADAARLFPPYLDAVERLVERTSTGWSTQRECAMAQSRRVVVDRSLVVALRRQPGATAARSARLRRQCRIQPPPPELTAAGQRLRPRHRRRERARRSTSMIRALQAATGDVVVVATVPTIEPLRATSASTPSSCSRTTAAASARRARTTAC